VQKLTVSLAPGQSMFLFVLLAVVALASVVFFYRRCVGEISTALFVFLLGLRVFAVVLLVLFIFRPVVSFERGFTQKSTLIFLVDNSGSMSIRDGASVPRRIELVKRVLPRRLEKLGADFDVKLYSFSNEAKQLELKQLDGLQADGEVTDLAAGIAGSLKAHVKANVSALILLSDGVDNSGKDPLQEVVRHGVRIFSVGVGSKLKEQEDFKDIAITNVETQRYVTVNNITEIRVLVEAVGYADRIVPVSIKQEGKEIASTTIRLDNLKGSQAAIIRYTPTEIGQFKYTAEIPLQTDERIEENNVHPFTLIVTKPRIKALYLEGVLRNEGKFILRTLQMDPNVEVVYLVRTKEGTLLQRGNLEGAKFDSFPNEYAALKGFNVLIVGDLDRSFFTTTQLENIRKWVKEGGGFVMLGGFNSFGPGGYAGTPIEEILPVRLGDRNVGQVKDEFTPTLTAEGETHVIMSDMTDFFPTSKREALRSLPKLRGCTVVLEAKPGATVIMENAQRKNALGQPLIVFAVQSYGEGRTAAFTADTTWQWFFELKAMGRESPYVKFWGQMVRWLANQEIKEKEEKPGITAFLDKQYYEPGELVKLYARVRDDQGKATNTALVEAALVNPLREVSSIQLAYVPGTTGNYEADFIPPTPGRYQIIFTAKQDGVLLGEEQKTNFRVGKPNLEFDQLDLNDALLTRIAEQTGGKYYYFVHLDDLLGSLEKEQREKTVIEKYDFFDTRYLPYFFALFVLAVSLEWWFRKARQLS